MVRSIRLAAAAILAVFITADPAAAQTLVPCAREGEFCRVPYPTQVVYGIPGRSAAVEVRGGGVQCSNRVFGDPAFGAPKRCAYVARDWSPRGPSRAYGESRYDEYRGPDRGGPAWQTCASENEYCDFRGVGRVRYGARGRFVEGTFRNGASCSNSVFGDPVPGQRKLCQVLR
jgi:hypothetical protein